MQSERQRRRRSAKEFNASEMTAYSRKCKNDVLTMQPTTYEDFFSTIGSKVAKALGLFEIPSNKGAHYRAACCLLSGLLSDKDSPADVVKKLNVVVTDLLNRSAKDVENLKISSSLKRIILFGTCVEESVAKGATVCPHKFVGLSNNVLLFSRKQGYIDEAGRTIPKGEKLERVPSNFVRATIRKLK